MGILAAIVFSSFTGLISAQGISTSTMVLASVHHKSNAQANSSWLSEVKHWWGTHDFYPKTASKPLMGGVGCGANQAWDSQVNKCVNVSPGKKIECPSGQFWKGNACVSIKSVLKSRHASKADKLAAKTAKEKEAAESQKACIKQWGDLGRISFV